MKQNRQETNGFEILIEKDLSPDVELLAKKFANNFINYVNDNNGSWVRKYSRAGYRSFLARNNLGYVSITKAPYIITFRRISNHKRQFAIHKIEHLKTKSVEILDLTKCVCPICMGNTKVTWKDNDNIPKFHSYHKQGVV